MSQPPQFAPFGRVLPLALGLALALVLSACGGRPASGPGAPSTSARLDGAEILRRACTVCHDLGGLAAYADYWGEAEWRSMMDTMISYGAVLTSGEYEVLARYLAETYGPASAAPAADHAEPVADRQ